MPFRRLLYADSPAEIVKLLADAARTELGADGAAVVEVTATGEAKVVEARDLPAAAASFQADLDVIDAELGERLLAACAGRFAEACTLPMMSGGDIFGALVLFSARPGALADEARRDAQTLADVAAVAVGKATQLAELKRSNAELRASREALLRTEKLRALGEMAAGISHDLKNILNPLSLHLQLLSRILKRGGQGAEEAIAEMNQVLRRGVETVERLREFSRQAPETRMERVDVEALTHEAVELSRPRVASQRARGVRVVEALGRTPPVHARPSELVVALLNLIVNAIDAVGEGGTVTVSSGEGDGGAWARVQDDGPGIPEEIQRRIFEPFFTTKGREGTGLGLAMVYAFVQRHGGKLTLDTGPDKGTTFTLWLPTAEPRP
ncbi:MAG: HAMP domain-containing sensor histidine kinase [Minicystis sp.]